ncbi:unnamed protein product [Sympodiomycopsis kandeliae]
MASVQHPSSSFVKDADKDALRAAYVGQPLSSLPTPALVLDQAIIRRNCKRMIDISQAWQVGLRVHIKTHKAAEGVRHMLDGQQGPGKIIVSTLAEAWGVLNAGLVGEGIVEDILFGLPVGPHKLAELHALREQVRSQSPGSDATVRLLVDGVEQLKALDQFAAQHRDPWSVMVKLEVGSRRAGLNPNSDLLPELLKVLSASQNIRLHGFYAHAGHSYSSTGPDDADGFLTDEVKAVNKASEIAHKILAPSALPKRLTLSVGSTPTAHAAFRASSSETIERLKSSIKGDLELHAGNYPILDLQQLATKAIPGITASKDSSRMSDVAISVLATVLSTYAGRGAANEQDERASRHESKAIPGDEALIDAGGIAFSKDVGQWDGYGHIIYPSQLRGWQLAKPSQEHGILTLRNGSPADWKEQWTLDDDQSLSQPRKPVYGEKVRVVPQHACMTCSAHPWFFIIDSDEGAQKDSFEQKVVDVWVPWKGW